MAETPTVWVKAFGGDSFILRADGTYFAPPWDFDASILCTRTQVFTYFRAGSTGSDVDVYPGNVYPIPPTPLATITRPVADSWRTSHSITDDQMFWAATLNGSSPPSALWNHDGTSWTRYPVGIGDFDTAPSPGALAKDGNTIYYAHGSGSAGHPLKSFDLTTGLHTIACGYNTITPAGTFTSIVAVGDGTLLVTIAGTNADSGIYHIVPAGSYPRANLASGTRTVSGVSSTFQTPVGVTFNSVLKVDAASGTFPTLDVELQQFNGAAWVTVGTAFNTKIAPGNESKSFTPAYTTCRWKWTIDGIASPSFTFDILSSILAQLLGRREATMGFPFGGTFRVTKDPTGQIWASRQTMVKRVLADGTAQQTYMLIDYGIPVTLTPEIQGGPTLGPASQCEVFTATIEADAAWSQVDLELIDDSLVDGAEAYRITLVGNSTGHSISLGTGSLDQGHWDLGEMPLGSHVIYEVRRYDGEPITGTAIMRATPFGETPLDATIQCGPAGGFHQITMRRDIWLTNTTSGVVRVR